MIKKGELIIRNMERSDVSLLKSWDTEEARGLFRNIILNHSIIGKIFFKWMVLILNVSKYC